MEGTAHRWASPGELVAYALPPGFHWLEILDAHAQSGASFLPIDVRLTAREQRAADRPRPALGRRASRRGDRARRRRADRSRTRLGGRGDERDVGAAPPGAAAARRRRVGGRVVVGCARRLGVRPVGVVPSTDAHRRSARAPARRAHRFSDHRAGAVRARCAARRTHRPARTCRWCRPCSSDWSAARPTCRGSARSWSAAGRSTPRSVTPPQRLGGRIVSTYGSTESCGGVVYDGVAFEGTRVRIAADRPDAIGGIEVAGPTLMDGYRADHAATAEAFADGRVAAHGRSRVDRRPGAAAGARARRTMRSAPVPRPCGPTRWRRSFGRTRRSPTSRWRAAPIPSGARTWSRGSSHAIPTDPPSLEQLREHCRDALARFKAPRDVRMVTTLPRTANGKVRRSALP